MIRCWLDWLQSNFGLICGRLMFLKTILFGLATWKISDKNHLIKWVLETSSEP